MLENSESKAKIGTCSFDAAQTIDALGSAQPFMCTICVDRSTKHTCSSSSEIIIYLKDYKHSYFATFSDPSY